MDLSLTRNQYFTSTGEEILTWRSNILLQRKSAIYAYCTLISREVIAHVISFHILVPVICSSSNAFHIETPSFENSIESLIYLSYLAKSALKNVSSQKNKRKTAFLSV